jgi:hypothetical protein
MKLFLISQKVNNDYDTYDSAVVCAPDEDVARNMSPSTGEPMKWNGENVQGAWTGKPSNVSVDMLGESVDGLACGVVCASFNAG